MGARHYLGLWVCVFCLSERLVMYSSPLVMDTRTLSENLSSKLEVDKKKKKTRAPGGLTLT